jgi:putative oxidoreductase
MSFLDRALSAHEGFAKAASYLQSPFLLAVRLYWGWQFAQTGWGKLQHLDKVTGFFTSLGILMPAASAVFVSWLEFVGGICLALGLGSRAFALLFVVDMLVAYWTASRPALFSVFSDPGKFYTDDAYTFLFASLLILIFGPGRFALDELLLSRTRLTKRIVPLSPLPQEPHDL